MAGKRELGNASTADLIVLLLISNTVQNAIIGDDLTLLGGILGAAILLGLNWGISKYEYRNHWFMHKVEGTPSQLIVAGTPIEKTLRKEKITHDELMAACRNQNVADFSRVKVATLETNGMITVVPDNPPDVVTERLSRIEEALKELLRRSGSTSDAGTAT